MRKSSIHRTLDNNQRVFQRYERDLPMETPGGIQTVRCLDLYGLHGLLFKLNTNKTTDKVQEALEVFQVWCIETLGDVSGKGNKPMQMMIAAPEGKEEWIDKAKRHLDFAKMVATETGADLAIAQAMALDAASKEVGLDLGPYKFLIPGMADQERGFLTPTQIAVRISKPGGREFRPHEINTYLKQNGYQLQDEKGGWHATEKGQPFAKEIPVMKGTWTGRQVLWHESIIPASKMGGNNVL